MGKIVELAILTCYYCRQFDGKEEPAHVTLHDKRGCLHVCIRHAKWRFAKSWLFGHSEDCAVAQQAKDAK